MGLSSRRSILPRPVLLLSGWILANWLGYSVAACVLRRSRRAITVRFRYASLTAMVCYSVNRRLKRVTLPIGGNWLVVAFHFRRTRGEWYFDSTPLVPQRWVRTTATSMALLDTSCTTRSCPTWGSQVTQPTTRRLRWARIRLLPRHPTLRCSSPTSTPIGS